MSKQKIIDVSLECFAYHGYENTSLTDIASKVGIKKPSLYNHFSSKEEIFLEVLKEVAVKESEHFQAFTRQTGDQPVKQRLEKVYHFYVDHMANSTEGTFFKRFTFFPPEDFSDEIKQVFLQVEEQANDIIRPIFKQGMDEGTLRHLPIDETLSAFYTLIDGLFLEENFYDKDTLAKREQASFKIFWLGVQKSSEED
ncbi:TetR/AcrR family transcriptional regulator [Halobacillus amylolyticus]|uniref:TetR/AcrR family transcriptional regulator n=1 Tax=Halobacillus amylolyticus TaxID=2932259 RepID=A0ABY4HG74_9BACI|nr:TetR/AcrR family transcriptional regulator [Halobacillus amylolyticus]UOR13378.1 TetR/AcrR family transcriptional regulator [Halobacillus amylolyticus]